MYHNPSAHACEIDCWASVPQVPVEFVAAPAVLRIFPEDCVSPPPLLGAVERKAECQREAWVDFNTVYARRNNGALFVWRFTSGGEYTFLTYFFLIIFGAVMLFAVVLAIMLLEGILRWLSKRAAASGAGAV